MLINNARFIIKSLITPTQGEGNTFNISEDLETDTHIETNGSLVSIVLQNNFGLERFIVSMTEGVATIHTRGLGKGEEKINNLDFQKQWIPGTIGYVTVLASDMLDIDDPNSKTKVTTNIDFEGDINFKVFSLPSFISEEDRDTSYKNPQNGDKCFLVGVGEQVFSSGIWSTLGISTPVPNATKEISGKIQIASDTEMNDGVDIGDTGAYLAGTPSQILGEIQKAIIITDPVGVVKIFTGSTAPSGYLFCHGQLLSKTEYSQLFAVIGNTYGGNINEFKLPDLRGNTPVGLKEGDNSFNVLGMTGGEKTHVLTVEELAPHSHGYLGTNTGQSNMGGTGHYATTRNIFYTEPSGSGIPHNNLQPYIVMNYIIKYK